MTAWRVTYLPDSAADPRRSVTVTVEDPESPSLATFLSRLSGGALGVEWTTGRVIQAAETFERHVRRQRISVATAIVVGIVVAIVLTGVVFPGSPTTSSLYQSPWSATAYTGASCGEGCFSQAIAESFPNGSYVAGTWTAALPAVLFIHTANGTLCPGGTPSSYGASGSCSEPGVTSGRFSFTSVGGEVYFTVGSQNPENVNVSGYWSASPP